MAHSFFRNRKCWMKHLSLNFTTGLDPQGIKLRNAQGLDAVDFFFPGVSCYVRQMLDTSSSPCEAGRP
jgi:Lecithin:cholesterol acyltransferase